MSHLRELTDAELDCVSGGAAAMLKEPARPLGGNPIIVILEDILRIVEGCEGNKRMAATKAF
jgi:hypothetical protein